MTVSKIPYRGMRLRITDWRMQQYTQVTLTSKSMHDLAKFIREAPAGDICISVKYNGTEDGLTIAAACRVHAENAFDSMLDEVK